MTTIHEIAESLRQSGELGERSLAALDRFVAASDDFNAKLAEAYASIPNPTNPKE